MLDKNNMILLEYHALRLGVSPDSLLNEIVDNYFQKIEAQKDGDEKKDFLEKADALEITQSDIALYLHIGQSSVSRQINALGKKDKSKLAREIQKLGGMDAFFVEVLKNKYSHVFTHSGLQMLYSLIPEFMFAHDYFLGFLVAQLQIDGYSIASVFQSLGSYIEKEDEFLSAEKEKCPENLIKKLNTFYSSIIMSHSF